MLQTVYREIDFEDEQTARQQRDAHLADLQAQGMECVAENLYNVVEGWRVFTLVAARPARPEITDTRRLPKPLHSGAAESLQQSARPKSQSSRPQKLPSKRAKFTYDVR
jgi:hypothetical protein